MKELRERYGNWTIVAGAALGLGESFCISLAKRGINIVMIDNQEKPLIALSDRLIKEYKIETLCLHIDLFEANAAAQIMVATSHLNIGLLVYNAAFSRIKKFTNISSDELDHFLNVNTATQIKLVHAFSKLLVKEKRPGGILMMSSLSGLIGMQLIAPYAATKAFAWNLAESLHYELKPENIDVTCCIAGATATDAFLQTNPHYGFIKPQVQQAIEVSEMALKKLGKKAVFIPGFSNQLNFFILTRLMPRKIACWFANRTMKTMYPKV